MEVILLEKIGKLGELGDKVTVKAGYGRNFLIPQGKAVAATEMNRWPRRTWPRSCSSPAFNSCSLRLISAPAETRTLG